jgi:hypothetical protein
MREFAPDEKKLLKRIRDGQGRNLFNLIDPWINGVSFQVNTETNSVDFIFEATPMLNLNERLEQIQTIVIQSVNLIKLFEEKGYILTFINANQLPDNPFTFGQAATNLPSYPYHFPDPRISQMFCEYSTREIFITPELNKFIKDGFITREAWRANRQWFTTMLALLVAVLALGLSIYLNLRSSSPKTISIQTQGKSLKKNNMGNPLSEMKSDTTIVSDTTIKITTCIINTKIDTVRK